MKNVRTSKVFAGMMLAGSALLSVPAWSMDVMSDGQLAQTTGQDGLTVSVALPVGGLTVDQVAIFDGNGFAGQTSAGAIVIGKNANGLAVGSEPTLGTGIKLTTNKNITAVIDASGGGGGGATTGTAPLVNIAVSLPTIMTLVTGDIGIAAATGAAGSYRPETTGSGVVQVMASTSMTFNLADSPLITLQLGKTNQGSMLKLTSLNISSVVFNSPVSLVSPNGGVGSSQITTTPTLTNLNLSGAGIGIYDVANYNTTMGTSGTTGGVIFRCANVSAQGCSVASPTTGFNVGLNDVMAGNTCATPCTGANIAQGLANAPLGSFGVMGMTVTNLKIGVSGM